MTKSRIDINALLLAVLGAALALALLSGPFAWLASIAGLILLLVLFSYDQDGYRSIFQSIAFSAVCGFCVALAGGIVFQLMAGNGEVHLANGQWSSKWMPITCGFATVIIWAIDRMRMSHREPVEIREARRATAAPASFILPSAPVPAAPEASPAQSAVVAEPVSQRAAPEPAPAPEPVIVGPSTPSAPPAAPQEASPAQPEPVLVRSAVAEPARPAVAPIIPRTGKETTIYVNLVGEGLNLLRSVKAEHVGRDFYKIIDETPEGETWEFGPGQVVRCKKAKLSTGKALVAFEEAPRAS